MKEKELLYEIGGITYPVIIVYKSIKNSYMRFKDGVIHITTRRMTSDKSIKQFLDRSAAKLVKKVNAIIEKLPYSFERGYVYIFGKKEPLISFKNETQLNNYLKEILLDELTKEVRSLEKEMNIKKPYKITVKKMKSRHGSNSKKTHTLSFQLRLVHFNKEVINSVVVHELCHDKYFDHSNKFYNEVYKYCSRYKEYKTILRKDMFDAK